ncbi:MAG: hypothetical protein JSV85_05055 [Candidatus Bathyarchaeota archaeon]|nr:MAG: hypothetical protein JSV85_05055 [Candidatus Bathyarchaeota archaeon]
MRLSSVLEICSGISNIGLACIFYYYAFISYLSGAGAVETLVVVGLTFTAIGLSSLRILKRPGERIQTLLGVALPVIAAIELGFSLLFFFFAYGGGHLSLLDVGIPLMLASTFSLAGTFQKYREARRRRANYVKASNS